MKQTRHLLLLIVALFAFTFTSCNNKNTPIHDLEDLCQELKENSQNYSDDDWAVVSQSMEQIQTEIDEHRSEYTDEEMREIDKLKGICSVYLLQYAIKNASEQVRDIFQQFIGGIEGVKNVIDNYSEEQK